MKPAAAAQFTESQKKKTTCAVVFLLCLTNKLGFIYCLTVTGSSYFDTYFISSGLELKEKCFCFAFKPKCISLSYFLWSSTTLSTLFMHYYSWINVKTLAPQVLLKDKCDWQEIAIHQDQTSQGDLFKPHNSSTCACDVLGTNYSSGPVDSWVSKIILKIVRVHFYIVFVTSVVLNSDLQCMGFRLQCFSTE